MCVFFWEDKLDTRNGDDLITSKQNNNKKN